MHTAYLCPLKRGSKFCLNKLEVQRNCNATDADLLTSEDANSVSNSHYALESLNSKMPIRSSTRASTAGAGTSQAKNGDDACTYYKHVGFSCDTARSRSKASQQRKSISFNGSCSVGGAGGGSGIRTRSNSSCHRCSSVKKTVELGCHSHAICSMLVPLTCNQSNFNKLHHMLEKSGNNVQETSANTRTDQSREQVLCEPPVRGGKDAAELVASSGVPYWNVYEYENFREIQHGNAQVFDPMTDSHLHRESIILDCYNRLQTSYPRFRKPQLYHVR